MSFCIFGWAGGEKRCGVLFQSRVSNLIGGGVKCVHRGYEASGSADDDSNACRARQLDTSTGSGDL